MSTMHIELGEDASQRIRDLADHLHQTPEAVANEVVANGTIMLQRYAYLKTRSEDADVAEALAFLSRPDNTNPPDPGDELPDDLKYLLNESR